MEITKKICDEMMARIDAAVKEIAKEYDLSGSCVYASFNSTSIDFKVRVEDTQGCWNLAVLGTGLKPEDLGSEIMLSGKKMRIRGWDFAAKTNKILLTEVSTGKNYCTNVHAVVAAIKAKSGVAEDNAADETAAEENEAAKKRAFSTAAWLIGAQGKVAYGQTVQIAGVNLRLVEINRRAPKFPLIAEDIQTGKRYKLAISDVVKEG